MPSFFSLAPFLSLLIIAFNLRIFALNVYHAETGHQNATQLLKRQDTFKCGDYDLYAPPDGQREMLGTGNFGVVFVAYARHIGRTGWDDPGEIALKEIPSRIRDDVTAGNEIARTELAGHPSMMTVYATCRAQNGNQYVVAERLYGMTIKEGVEAGWYNDLASREGTLKAHYLGALRAVEYIHSKGHTHGDPHYEQFIVTSDGTVKLMDFDLVGVLPWEVDMKKMGYMLWQMMRGGSMEWPKDGLNKAKKADRQAWLTWLLPMGSESLVDFLAEDMISRAIAGATRWIERIQVMVMFNPMVEN